MTHSRSMRLSAMLVALLLSALIPATAGGADARMRVIVHATTALEDAATAVTAWGGEVVRELGPFGMLVAEVPAGALDELHADARTGTIAPDSQLEVHSQEFEDGAVQAATAATNAPTAWAEGNDGEGVGVVLVDTGISEHPDLGDRVIAAIDFTEEQDGLDHHGHGTFLAGLVAGDGSESGGVNAGVAPGAHLVSVKVAGKDGTTTLSAVLQGLVAADRARELYDSPVVLLALSGPVGNAPDPIMIALEMLWARGSVVVVTAGNSGPDAGSVGSPGADPYLITVGATDGDTVADWSSRGPNPWGHAKPDLVAPGTSTIGLRAPGSTIDNQHPTAKVDDHYFKGTGTSMSAALAAGAAAVVLSADPGLSPDGVKGRLMAGADGSLDADRMAMGAGALDVAAAVDSDAGPANQDLPPLPEPRTLPGKRKAVGHATGKAAAPATAGWNWGGWNWGGWNWSHTDWTGWNWSAEYWAGWNWGGWNWGSSEWSGWNWSGWNWSGWNWSGWNWSGWNWSGWNWSGWNWSGWNWSGWNWSGWEWTGWSWG
ncbi:MAG: S8 family serine peptidase [Nitriliruptorales bacterium]|nr:S8 family serine peptidase [Nitriliruptorales bacterium]